MYPSWPRGEQCAPLWAPSGFGGPWRTCQPPQGLLSPVRTLARGVGLSTPPLQFKRGPVLPFTTSDHHLEQSSPLFSTSKFPAFSGPNSIYCHFLRFHFHFQFASLISYSQFVLSLVSAATLLQSGTPFAPLLHHFRHLFAPHPPSGVGGPWRTCQPPPRGYFRLLALWPGG